MTEESPTPAVLFVRNIPTDDRWFKKYTDRLPMVQVSLLSSISGNMRSGGFLLGRSGDAVLVQFVVIFFTSYYVCKIKFYPFSSRGTRENTLIAVLEKVDERYIG